MTRLGQAQQLFSEMTPEEKIDLLRWLIRDLGGPQAVLDALDDATLIQRAREAAKHGFATAEETQEFIQRMLSRDADSL